MAISNMFNPASRVTIAYFTLIAATFLRLESNAEPARPVQKDNGLLKLRRWEDIQDDGPFSFPPPPPPFRNSETVGEVPLLRGSGGWGWSGMNDRSLPICDDSPYKFRGLRPYSYHINTTVEETTPGNPTSVPCKVQGVKIFEQRDYGFNACDIICGRFNLGSTDTCSGLYTDEKTKVPICTCRTYACYDDFAKADFALGIVNGRYPGYWKPQVYSGWSPNNNGWSVPMPSPSSPPTSSGPGWGSGPGSNRKQPPQATIVPESGAPNSEKVNNETSKYGTPGNGFLQHKLTTAYDRVSTFWNRFKPSINIPSFSIPWNFHQKVEVVQPPPPPSCRPGTYDEYMGAKCDAVCKKSLTHIGNTPLAGGYYVSLPISDISCKNLQYYILNACVCMCQRSFDQQIDCTLPSIIV